MCSAAFRRLQDPRSIPAALLGISSLTLGGFLNAAEIHRSDRATGTTSDTTSTSTGSAGVGTPTPVRASAAARLQAAREAAVKARELQATAATLARNIIASQKTADNTWKVTLPGSSSPVVVTGGLSASGLKVRPGGVWSGAEAPKETAATGTYEKKVEITQTQQQAVLDWESFNVASNTHLYFNQTAGGDNVSNWIAFNRIGVTDRPSVIQGKIEADGQVYIINPNGILFGGSAQVNTHALVASALPVNENLINRGLLNNPDAQFLFSGFSQSAGSNGPTAASTPKVTDIVKFPEVVAAEAASLAARRPVAVSTSTEVVARADDGTVQSLSSGGDFSQVYDAISGKTTLTFTEAGLSKISGKSVEWTYTPTASSSGNVTVEAGARLYAPSTGNNVGGRITLVGANVVNQGHISAPDGQVVLAAGLEVGLAAHSTSDPSLRGVDAYVGRVSDSFSQSGTTAGSVTNGSVELSNGSPASGVIETRDWEKTDAKGNATPMDTAGSILLTGREVVQNGILNSTTTVSFNGRIDLNASYNAAPNPVGGTDASVSVPFLYGSESTVPTTGKVELGASSVTSVLPSTSSTDKIARAVEDGVALKSEINLTGRAVYLAGTGTTGASIIAPSGNVALKAGNWTVLNPSNPTRTSQFYRGEGQVYFDAGSSVDVSGIQGAQASVTDLIVEAQLRGSELANSPLQRDGALRGQTIKVDSRVHGAWDPTLNGGKGGYTWIGTPLGNVSGWINLAQRTAEQLSTAGGTIDIQAGDSVVLRKGAVLDVSGGWTNYAAGRVETTKVVSEGRVVDISKATPDKVYSGIFTGATATENKTWGVTDSTANSVLLSYNDPGYWQGGDGGKLSLASGSMAVDGTLLGAAYSGDRQTLVAPIAGSLSLVARPSQLLVNLTSQRVNPNFGNSSVQVSSNPADVYLTTEDTLADSVADFAYAGDAEPIASLDEERRKKVQLNPLLWSSGEFGFLTLNAGDDNVGTQPWTDGVVRGNVYLGSTTQSAGAAALSFGPNSAVGRHYGIRTLDITGANVYLNGGVVAPGSLLRFQASNFSASAEALNGQAIGSTTYNLDPSVAREGRGSIIVRNGVAIDTRGLVIDARTGGSAIQATRGGDVTLSAYKVTVGEGSAIDVSGGLTHSGPASLTWAQAGTIELLARNEQQLSGATLTLPASHRGFESGDYLRGYSGLTSGGGLRVSSTGVGVVQGSQSASGDAAAFQLASDFFSRGGFSQFSVTGMVDYAAPNRAAVRIGETSSEGPTWSLTPTVASWTASTGLGGGVELSRVNYSESGRQSPFFLSLNAATPNMGITSVLPPPGVQWSEKVSAVLPISTASGLSVVADDITFLGQVQSQGGSITLQSRAPSSGSPAINLFIGPRARISATGGIRSQVNRFGQLEGIVLSGGRVSVQGNAVLATGAVIDVSGAKGSLYVNPAEAGQTADLLTTTARSSRVEKEIVGNGGSISLTGTNQLHVDATLKGEAGGTGGVGGTLTVVSGLLNPGQVAPESAPNLLLTESSNYSDVDLSGVQASILGRESLADKKGTVISTYSADGIDYLGGRIATTTFASGGFGTLNFEGRVKFLGDVSISAGSTVSLGSGGLLVADSSKASTLRVTAPYIQLGGAFSTPLASAKVTDLFRVAPTSGAGKVSLIASKWMDVGTLSLREIGTTELVSQNGGDLRGSGAFAASGQVSFSAGQIYAPTATDFVVAVDGSGGSFTVNSSGAASQVPLSAGSSLNLFAETIVQKGTLRAPFGRIRLGTTESTVAALGTFKAFTVAKTVSLEKGSVTSVSSVDYNSGKIFEQPVPYGANTTGSVWIDPTGADITVRDAGGRTTKSIDVSGLAVTTATGSTVDISGGGELFVDRWVSGQNGTQELFAASGKSYALLPGYQASLAPYGAFASGAALLEGDTGYASTGLKAGDTLRIDLGTGAGEMDYVLLPARYALLPGAFLVTPVSGATTQGATQADGSRVANGIRFNALAGAASANLYSSWEILRADLVSVSKPADGSVSKARSQHDLSYANTFFTESAAANSFAVRRLPRDAGQLVFSAVDSLQLQGSVEAAAVAATTATSAGRGGLVDINTSGNIVISNTVAGTPQAGTLQIRADDLSRYSTESLLVGGRRSDTDAGTRVEVAASSVKLNGSGTLLTGTDVTLVAKDSVEVAAGATLRQTGEAGGQLDTLIIGSVQNAGSSNAAALRVSASENASISGIGAEGNGTAALTVASGSEVSGRGVTLATAGKMTVFPGAGVGGGVDGRASTLSIAASAIGLSSLYASESDRAIVSQFFGVETTSPWLFLSSADLIRYAAGSATSKGFSAINLDSSSSLYLGAAATETIGGAGLQGLSLNAREIRLFGGNDITLNAGTISLGNRFNATSTGNSIRAVDTSGTFALRAESGSGLLRLGAGELALSGFAKLDASASNSFIFGSLAGQGNALTRIAGDFKLKAPAVIVGQGKQVLEIKGDASLEAASGSTSAVAPTGGVLELSAASLSVDAPVMAPAGKVTLRTTDGNLAVNGLIDASGRAIANQDLARFAPGGAITLSAQGGTLDVQGGAVLNVSASQNTRTGEGYAARIGDAGSITLTAIGDSTTPGIVTVDGTLLGQGGGVGAKDVDGVVGRGGTFNLDAQRLNDSGEAARLASLSDTLSQGGFTQAVSIRTREGDLIADGTLAASAISLSTDNGDVTVSGTLDASGATGGRIEVAAQGAVTVTSSAILRANGEDYDAAGKGGSIFLSAGASSNGVVSLDGTRDAAGIFQEGAAALSIAEGAQLQVGVSAGRFVVTNAGEVGLITGDVVELDEESSFVGEDGTIITIAAKSVFAPTQNGVLRARPAAAGRWLVQSRTGQSSGTVHLRAPQTVTNDAQINRLAGTIEGASSVAVEGFSIHTSTTGSIDDLKSSALAKAAAFGSSANEALVRERIFGDSNRLASVVHIRPGLEIVSTSASPDLTLAASWDLSLSRFGNSVNGLVLGSGESGYLTLRAAGDLAFAYRASLNDGFTTAGSAGGLWQGRLLAAGSSSWSYRLVAGADLSSASLLGTRTDGFGSVVIGKGSPDLNASYTRANATNTNLVPQFFQTIRTGTGDISIASGADVQFRNPLATVYTAGQQVRTPGSLFATGDFDVPHTNYDGPATVVNQHYRLNNVATPYPVYFTWGGGDVSIQARHDLVRLNAAGEPDSAKQMPTNWLYRRGKLDSSGNFDTIVVRDTTNQFSDVASTSWWVDFSNFFLDVGALGGGNVSLSAGGDIRNVSAAAPTNARMTKTISEGSGVSTLASRQKLVELGGGSVTLSAGGDVDGGVYYTERGDTVVRAGGAITTNATRATLPAATLATLPLGQTTDPITWLPTTFFIGKGDVRLTASEDIKLGQVVNPFLLPQAINNSFYQTSYFSTRSTESKVRATSLFGDIDLIGNTVSGVGTLYRWYNSVLYSSDTVNGTAAARNQPWLRLAFGQSALVPAESFQYATTLLPSSVTLEALEGDIRIHSYSTPLALAPGAKGGLNLFAQGAISGLSSVGLQSESDPHDASSNPYSFGSALVHVSDADPARIPGVYSPEGYSYRRAPLALTFPAGILSGFNSLFTDSGATAGENTVLQTQLRLHGSNPDAAAADESKALHAGDTAPMYVYANTGDIKGLQLITPKSSRIMAGRDITDVAFYLQNSRSSDISLVSAGRDIVAYNPTSSGRLSIPSTPLDDPKVGDLQISGPGSLQVLAGRNIALGAPLSFSSGDGTGSGISSVGSVRNPNLPYGGADITVGAGLDNGTESGSFVLRTQSFIERYLNPLSSDGSANPLAARYLPELAARLGMDVKASLASIWAAFGDLALSDDAASAVLNRREQLALSVFFTVLRDAGRDRNNPEAENYGTYKEGSTAIATLFPSTTSSDSDYSWKGTGNVALNSRSIRTTRGGDITIVTPGGGIELGRDAFENGPPPGIVTESGGDINLFTSGNVDVGSARIFTLKGGSQVIWSSRGSIAAGVSSKTVQAAPPTRVIVDPQSADVKTDLAGLATGGGIGVLATVAGVEAGDVDLIAPLGVIDAGDAGIRSSGKLNVAAAAIRNAANISSGGQSSGVPPAPPAPSVGAIANASNAAAAAGPQSDITENKATPTVAAAELLPSLVTVEVLGYGGGDDEDPEEPKGDEGKSEDAEPAAPAP